MEFRVSGLEFRVVASLVDSKLETRDPKPLDAMTEETIQRILSRYPDRRSALLPLMHLCQEEAGYLTEEAMRELAARLD